MALCEKLEKVPVHLKKEVDGFLLNRIFLAINREALWLLEMGVASVEDIDKDGVNELFCAKGPWGPLGVLPWTAAIENWRLAPGGGSYRRSQTKR